MEETNSPSTTSAPAGAAARTMPAGGHAQTGNDGTVTGKQRSDVNREAQSDGGIVDRVKDRATAQLTSQKDRGVDALGTVAQAVRSSTQRLREEQHDTIAGYVDKAADQIESWSERLRDKDVDELLSDVQQLARRQPAVFIGAAFTLGLVGARFLKSSRRSQPSEDYRSESRRAQYGARPPTSATYDRGTGGFQTEEVTSTVASAPNDTEAPARPRAATRRARSRTGQS